MLAEAYIIIRKDQSKFVYSEKRALGGILAAGALAASPAAARDQPDASKGFLGDAGLEELTEILQGLEGDLSDNTNNSNIGEEASAIVFDAIRSAAGIPDAEGFIDIITGFITDILKLVAMYAGIGIFLKYGLSFLLKLFVQKFLLKQLDNTKDRLLKKLPAKVQQEVNKLEDLEQTNPQEFAKRVGEIQKRCEANLDKKLNFVGMSQMIIYNLHKYTGKAIAATAGFKLTVLLFFCHLLVKYGVNLTSVFF